MHPTMIRNLAIVVALLAISAGCRSTSPEGSRPTSPAPEKKPSPSTSAATSTSAGGSSASASASSDYAALPDRVREYIASMRRQLSSGKAELYQEVMSPTSQEASVFWPIYAEYEEEIFALGDRRLQLMRKLAEARDAKALDAAAATDLANEFLKIQRKSLDLLEKYHGRISKELSPLQAAQFLQIEHRTATVTDLLVASEIPLLKLEPVDGSPLPLPPPPPPATE